MPKCGSATAQVVCLLGTTNESNTARLVGRMHGHVYCKQGHPSFSSAINLRVGHGAANWHPDRDKYGSPPLLGHALDDTLGDIETAVGHCYRAATKGCSTPDGHREDRPKVRRRSPRWKTSKSWRLCHDPPGARHDS